MSTALPLFWHLSSLSKKERVDASVKLLSALQQFQTQFCPKDPDATSDSDEGEQVQPKSSSLDVLNAPDVSYSIRRLIRGLASPRESSRLGFAVALTELLSRLDTITCSQILTLVIECSQTQGSMSGQEVRDVLFARLFGLTAIIRSGLLFRQTPLPNTTNSPSNVDNYREAVAHLLTLGEKKSWLRESAWWSFGMAVDALLASEVPWKDEAVESTYVSVFSEQVPWTPEKVALAAKLRTAHPSRDWRSLLGPTLKHPDLLDTANFGTLSKILKETPSSEDDSGEVKSKSASSGSWKPQPHYVWGVLLDLLLPEPNTQASIPSHSFQEFFRIVVDETLFSSSASPARKYWGFQVFQKALTHPQMTVDKLGMLFTKNFMRCWINQLGSKDRFLNKAARQVASSIPPLVQQNPTLGFTLILQLTGVNGSRQFDKLTRTKTIEFILTAMDTQGILKYIDWLLGQVNEDSTGLAADGRALSARRLWIIDQLASLIRNGAIPKDDIWVKTVLDWLAVHGLFVLRKADKKSAFLALRAPPEPAFTDDLREACRVRLLACLADLTGQTTALKTETQATRVAGVDSSGCFWITKILSSIMQLETDKKHVNLLVDIDQDDKGKLEKAMQSVEALEKVSGGAPRGTQLLLVASIVHLYCIGEAEAIDLDSIVVCADTADMIRCPSRPKSKKKTERGGVADSEPVDVLVDMIIGFLEHSTAYLRTVGNQAFALLSGSIKEGTISLILTQLERRDPASDKDEEDENEEESNSDSEPEGVSDDEDPSHDSQGTSDDEDTDDELREQIEGALLANGIKSVDQAQDDDSEGEELMNDEQMMAVDEQLAEIFRSRTNENKFGKGIDAQRNATHFKNRVLDLIDLFVKHQPTSPHVVRLIIPLVELITGTSSDEQQLSDKARGILASRIGKLKDVPPSIDTEQVVQIFDDAHNRARRNHYSDLAGLLSQCSLYLCKLLLHFGLDKPVIQAYHESLTDYATRKASTLNIAFFQDFVRRYPLNSWELRQAAIEASAKCINVFRQRHIFQLLQGILKQVSVTSDRQQEIIAFMPILRDTLLDTMSRACEEGDNMSTAQMKDVLKLAVSALRQTRRLPLTEKEVSSIWRPSKWEAMGKRLATVEKFTASPALRTLCDQMTTVAGTSEVDSKARNKEPSRVRPPKRKVDERNEIEGRGARSEKPKRKKR